jgi:predicted GNAT family N-acyltransferase
MFRVTANEADLLGVYCVRSIVFVGEQGCPFREEFDGLDAGAIHILGVDAYGEPVAAARLRDVDGWAKLERIALVESVRGRGLGHELVEFLLGVARERGFRRFKMHAQSHLEAFYAQHGFVRTGLPFMEAGIEHLVMRRED